MKESQLRLNAERPYHGVITTSNGDICPINGSMEGMSAFLICGGPSLKDILDTKLIIYDREYTGREALNLPGFVTMAVNNSVRTFRPNLWCCTDDPANFMKSIWLDPKIQKFTPTGKITATVWDNGPPKWEMTDIPTASCPNVNYFTLRSHFEANEYLTDSMMTWGNESKTECSEGIEGKRSVMLPALRILYELGIRNVYLLGCDFTMTESATYHFEQKRHEESVKSNTATYKALNIRFDAVKEDMLARDFNVFNCNPESNLKSFPFRDFAECLGEAIRFMPDVENERTQGMYDRKRDEKLISESMMIYVDEDREYNPKDYEEYTPEIEDYTNGILYYNHGTKYLPRLMTSIHSLRKVYDGNIAVVSTGRESNYICKRICEHYGCIMITHENNLGWNDPHKYEKTRLNQYTPFQNTLYLDCDTIIKKDISHLFELIAKNGFVISQFSDWRTKRRVIQKRLKPWKKLIPSIVDDILEGDDPHINVGMFGFTKDSFLVSRWFDLCSKGQTISKSPDEVSCQLLVHTMNPVILDETYNYSCKYGIANIEDCAIIHYHSNKHCRLNKSTSKPENNAQYWIDQWEEVFSQNICEVQDWVNRSEDKLLMRYLRTNGY